MAMTDAKSTDPKVFNDKIMDVANPPGDKVYNYADAVKALQAGKKINYEGASGSQDFDKYHNTFTAFDVAQFDASGNLHTVMNVPASEIAGY